MLYYNLGINFMQSVLHRYLMLDKINLAIDKRGGTNTAMPPLRV